MKGVRGRQLAVGPTILSEGESTRPPGFGSNPTPQPGQSEFRSVDFRTNLMPDQPVSRILVIGLLAFSLYAP
jgi:hypothetical protein